MLVTVFLLPRRSDTLGHRARRTGAHRMNRQARTVAAVVLAAAAGGVHPALATRSGGATDPDAGAQNHAAVVVEAGRGGPTAATPAGAGLPGRALLAPANGSVVSTAGQRFSWVPDASAFYYRLVLTSEASTTGSANDISVIIGAVPNEPGGPIACAAGACTMALDPAALPGGLYRWTVEAITTAGVNLPGLEFFLFSRAAGGAASPGSGVGDVGASVLPQGAAPAFSLLAPGNGALVTMPSQRFRWVEQPLDFYSIRISAGVASDGFSLDADVRIGGVANQPNGPACANLACVSPFDPASLPNGRYQWSVDGLTLGGGAMASSIDTFQFRRAPEVIFGGGFEAVQATMAE